MMSRIVTTRKADPIITAAKIQNSASSQSWPRNSSMITAMPVTMPSTREPEDDRDQAAHHVVDLLVVRRCDGRSAAVAVAVAVRVSVAVAARRDAGDGRRQHRQHPRRGR